MKLDEVTEIQLIVTGNIYCNLNDHHKSLLSSYNDGQTQRYEGDIIRNNMEDWYKENCK